MHVFLLCAHVHYRRPWSLDMSTSCPLSLSLPNQKHFLLLLSVCSSSSSSRPRFFLLFSSGQGCTSNYKSIEAWPGLCNLCGIFVQRRFCVRAASENGLGSAFWSGIGLFLSALFPTNPNRFFNFFFYEELGWIRMFHMHVRTRELDRSRSSTLPLDFPQIFHCVRALSLACSDFWTWVLNAGSLPAQSPLFSRLYRSASTAVFFFFPPSTHSALLYSRALIVNRACPLASSFLWSPPLYWGRNCGRAM